jgi:hypothetical protein
MPSIDFNKPQTFLNTLEPLALALNCALVALRDEAHFQDERDEAIVAAAALLSSMLEDARLEVEALGNRLERGRFPVL